MTTKRCSKCGEVKDVEEFTKHRKTKDGLRGQCKTCVAISGRAYRATSKEKIAIKDKQYRIKNKDKIKFRQSAYYAKNKDSINAKQKRYHAEHRAERTAYIKAYYINNKDKIKEKVKEWVAANPEKRKINSRKWQRANRERWSEYKYTRRAREMSADGRATTIQIQARWNYYGNKCYICGALATETDHVKPLDKGGSNWPCNLRPICKHCNRIKSAKWPYDFKAAREAMR